MLVLGLYIFREQECFLAGFVGVWFVCLLGAWTALPELHLLLSSRCDLSCFLVELFALDFLFLQTLASSFSSLP